MPRLIARLARAWRYYQSRHYSWRMAWALSERRA